MNLIYVMDPMCSWCWAFAPVMEKLEEAFPQLTITYVMGGLAPDSDQPMPAPMRAAIQSIWHEIERRTGTPFNHDFWETCQPRRSTYPACRAVIAAESMQPGCANRMIRAIQTAYYQDTRNPSDASTLIDLAEGIGLGRERFREQLGSDETQQTLNQHLQLAHSIGASGFPSLYRAEANNVTAISQGYVTWETLKARIEQEIKRG